MTPLLQLQGVHTHIGAYHILHGVDFEVPSGQVTVLLGRNGAGKTTTLRTIMGLWAASQGAVRFDGVQIGGPGGQSLTPDIVQRGIAYVPENMGIFSDLTVREVGPQEEDRSDEDRNRTRPHGESPRPQSQVTVRLQRDEHHAVCEEQHERREPTE